MKQCGKCKKELLLDLFHKQKGRKNGRASYCKKCLSEYRKQHLWGASASLKQKTNGTWTLKDKEKAFLKQKRKCAVCKKKLLNWRNAQADHMNKQKRELLCRRCNIALGYVEDKKWFKKASCYVVKHGGKI